MLREVLKLVRKSTYVLLGNYHAGNDVVQIAKPRVSLTVPNCKYFVQVTLTVLELFWMQLPKLKN